MTEEELNKLEHAAETFVMGGLEWRLGEAIAYVRAERDEQESEKNAALDLLRSADAEIERLTAERDELRAQLDAEQERLSKALALLHKSQVSSIQKTGIISVMRAQLAEARETLVFIHLETESLMPELARVFVEQIARIDAAQKEQNDGQ